MPKVKPLESVLHDWVHMLPFQMQALLMTAMRGPDGSSKYNNAKYVVRYLRGAVIKPAGDWSGSNDNSFMWGDYSSFGDYCEMFWGDHDDYHHHFIMHLLHAAEVIGYEHPDSNIRDKWKVFYRMGCASFHMEPESRVVMWSRLNNFGCDFYSKPAEYSIEEYKNEW